MSVPWIPATPAGAQAAMLAPVDLVAAVPPGPLAASKWLPGAAGAAHHYWDAADAELVPVNMLGWWDATAATIKPVELVGWYQVSTDTIQPLT